MTIEMAPNSALALFREEFAEGLQKAISAREMSEDPMPAFLSLGSAFEEVASAELAQWVNIIAELGQRVGEGLGELPDDLGEAVSVTTEVLVHCSHLGLDFLRSNARATSTWCAIS